MSPLPVFLLWKVTQASPLLDGRLASEVFIVDRSPCDVAHSVTNPQLPPDCCSLRAAEPGTRGSDAV